MDITNLDDHRKIWKTDAAACAARGHSWQAVYPVGAEDVGLECPSCGSGLGSVLPNDDKSKLSPNDDFDSTLHWRVIDTIPHNEVVLICDVADSIVKYGRAEIDETGETLIVCGGIPVTRKTWWTHWAYISFSPPKQEVSDV